MNAIIVISISLEDIVMDNDLKAKIILVLVMILCVAIIFAACGLVFEACDACDCGGGSSSSGSKVCGICGGDGVFQNKICKYCGGWGER